MAEPLAIDALLEPIPGNDPAGEAVDFAVRTELEEARKEINLEDFADDDPLKPTEPKKADWPGIVKRTTQILTSQSKDLLTAARLTEALTKLQGFAGLADGLTLLSRMIAECWDRLNPKIESPDDIELRAGPFSWLGDDGRGAKFPYTIRTVPIFQGEAGWYSYRDWQLANDPARAKEVNREDIEKSVTNLSRDGCQGLVTALESSLRAFTGLNQVLGPKLGSDAPSMADLRKAIEEVYAVCKQLLQRKGGPVEEKPATEETPADGEQATQQGSVAAAPAKAMITRDDIYQRLTEAADLLLKMEPHSPVPYLIRRAVEWGSLPFPQLMKALIRTDYEAAIVEMNRELGIKEEPPA